MIREQTTTDPVLDEIHRTPHEISARFGGDLHAILDDVRKRQAVSELLPGHPNRRTMRCNGAAVEAFLTVENQLPPPADRGR